MKMEHDEDFKKEHLYEIIYTPDDPKNCWEMIGVYKGIKRNGLSSEEHYFKELLYIHNGKSLSPKIYRPDVGFTLQKPYVGKFKSKCLGNRETNPEYFL